jgi:hypothetical protein
MTAVWRADVPAIMARPGFPDLHRFVTEYLDTHGEKRRCTPAVQHIGGFNFDNSRFRSIPPAKAALAARSGL